MSFPIRRALLIGINDYKPDPKTSKSIYQNLHGSVRDVELVEKFLYERVGLSKTDITALKTSSTSEGSLNANNLNLPTAQNIFRQLNRLCNICKPGDLVYIHYSGHGVRRGDAKFKDLISENNSQNETGDRLMGTAIVPTDASVNKVYITGYYIGSIIQKMVREKGARVCLVLDSCHSGRGIRGDTPDDESSTFAPRYADIDVDYDWMRESDEAADAILKSLSVDLPGTRAAQLATEWFMNPTGCTIMTACKSMRRAGEDFFAGSDFKQGVHTFWMLDILQKHKWERFPTYASIRDHIHQGTRSPSHFIPQDPYVYGDVDVEFFGNTVVFERSTCNVVDIWGSFAILDVGEVQGVAVGAVYQILPHESSEDQRTAKLQVMKVNPFFSAAMIISDSKTSEVSRFTCPAKAKLLRWALPGKIKVHFATNDENMRSIFRQELEKTLNLSLTINNDEPAELVVAIDRSGYFTVEENGVPLHRLPLISTKDHNAVSKMAYVISHLARYRAIEGILDLPGSTHLRDKDFEYTVSRQIEDDPFGDQYEEISPDDLEGYKVRENDTIRYSFCYSGMTETLWVAIYEANETWGITRIFPDHGPTAWEIDAGMPERIEFTVNIQPGYRDKDPIDVTSNFIVFFATGDTAPSWDDLQLPSLPKDSSLIPLDLDDVGTKMDTVTEEGLRIAISKGPNMNGNKRTRLYYTTNFQIHTFPR